jgi:hypothetical protein
LDRLFFTGSSAILGFIELFTIGEVSKITVQKSNHLEEFSKSTGFIVGLGLSSVALNAK